MNLIEHRLFRFLILIVSFGLCLSAGGTILDLWHRRDVVKLRQHDLDRVSRENAELKQQLRESQEPDYVERVARDKLGMVRDGEAIVLLNSRDQSELNSGGAKGEAVIWRQWWHLFF